MFCGGCYYDLEAVCREYWTYGNSGWLFCCFVQCSDETSLPLPSLEGSVHSNDSLSDSSPPATAVPTQVVQPVQTTQQVRCTHIHKPRSFTIWPRRSKSQRKVEHPLVLSDTVALLTCRGQCYKRCRRQPRGFRSTTYSLWTLTRR